MSVTIDSLDIQIRSSAGSAAKNIDDLAKALGNLNANSKVTKIVNSLNRLNTALSDMRSQQAVMSHLSALSKALSHLAAIPKLTGLQSAIRELKKLPEVAANLDTAKISQFTTKMKLLSDGLAPLATQIDKISKGFSKLPPQVSKCATAVKRLDSAQKSGAKSAKEHGNALNHQSFNLLATYEHLSNVFSIMHGIQDAASNLMNDAIQWDGIQFRFGRAFGEDAETALDYARKVSDEMRINVQQFMQYSSMYGSLLSGFGMAQKEVTTISLGLTELSYDIWAAYNDRYRTLEDASEAIRSAITGEIEPIRNAGIALTEASMQEYLDSIGMASTSVEKLTEAQKSELRYAVMVNSAMKQGIVGTYAREMDTAEGAIRTLTQQLKTLGQALGSLFLPILQAVIPWLSAFVELLTEGISALAAMFGIEFQKIQWGDASGMKQTAEGAGATADALGVAADNAKKMKNYALGFDELNVISQDSGSGTSGGAGTDGSGGSLGLDLDTLWDDAVFASVSDKIDKIKEKIRPFFDWMKENGKDILDIVLNIGGAFLGWKMASSFIGNIKETIENLKEMDKLSKVTLGLSLLVSGITLAYEGGFDIGYEGPTLMNVLKTALGAALGIAGSLLIFGTGPVGWIVGIGVALTALVSGITVGTKKKNLLEDQASHFGEYVLSKEELQEMVESLTTVEVSTRLDLHVDQQAIVSDAEEALEAALGDLRKLNLKLEIGLDVSQETYSAAVDRLVENISTYISEKQVEYALAIDVTLDGTSTGTRLTEFSNTFFLETQGKLTDLGNKLKSIVSTGFVDGEWIPEKLQEAIELQKEIQEVLDYVSDKEFQAKMAALKLDASGTTLSYQSMEQLLTQANDAISEKMKDLEAVRIQQIQIAQMEFDQNVLKGMSEAEAQKILDTTLSDIQNAFLSSQVELNLGPVTFGLDSIASAYSKELEMAIPVMQQSVGELFVRGTMAVLPEQTYENANTLVMQLRDAYTIGLEQLDISDAARENMSQLLSAMKPTLEDLESVAEEARKAGQTVPEEVSKGLSDAAQLAAVAGNAEAINYLVGEKLSTDSSFLNMLATAENAGMSIDDSMAQGLLNNIEYVKDQATGVVTGIKNSMTGEVVAITPTMVSNFEQLGVDVSDGLFDGANKQMAAKKTSWLDWAIWPWNWFKEKNEINSPSKLFERGGEFLGEGLLNGVKNKWEDIKTWYNLHVAPKFTMAYWLDKFRGIGDGFKQTIKNAVNNGIGLMNKFIGWLNEKLNFSWDALTLMGKEVYPAGSIQLFTIPEIPKLEKGGFLEDGLFTMNRGEIAGKFNNGKSVVANNQQIVEGIAAGVYEAVVAAMNATSGRGEQSVNVYLDGKQITAAVEKRQNERGRSLMGNQLGYVY